MIEKYFENLTPLTKLRLHEVTKIVLFSHIDQDSILVGINNKGQDVSANSTVIFTTVHTTVKVTDSNNQPIDGAEVSGTLKIYDILGREVAKLVNREQKPGFYKAV